MNLVIEKSEPPVITKKYKYAPITKELLLSKDGEWIKVTGFDNVSKLMSAFNTLFSGKRSISKHLSELGYKIETHKDTLNLALYIRKIRPTSLALDGAIAPDNQQVLPADVLEGEGALPEPPRQ